MERNYSLLHVGFLIASALGRAQSGRFTHARVSDALTECDRTETRNHRVLCTLRDSLFLSRAADSSAATSRPSDYRAAL